MPAIDNMKAKLDKMAKRQAQDAATIAQAKKDQAFITPKAQTSEEILKAQRGKKLA